MLNFPSLFISHGSPMFALQPGRLGPQLARLGAGLPRPRAVLVLSPHWMTRGIEVQAGATPATLHDFGGFAPALYNLAYPAPGAPELVDEVQALLTTGGFLSQTTTAGGFDHGVWVPLLHLFPEADIPVLQLSQPATRDPLQLFALGEALSSLREAGVLIVGSGSLTHNLHEFRSGTDEDNYANEFSNWIWQRLAAGELDLLFDYRAQAPHAARAHPTNEHLLPLFFALGAAGADRSRITRLEGGVSHGVISMDSFVFGAPPVERLQ